MLWWPKNGFPQTPFQESPKNVSVKMLFMPFSKEAQGKPRKTAASPFIFRTVIV